MEKDSSPVFSALGDSAILIEWGNTISLPLNQHVNALAGIIRQKPFAGFVDAVPAYCSLTILYNVYLIKRSVSISSTVYEWVHQQVTALLNQIDPEAETSPFIIEIPVCYDEALSNDLNAISKSTQLSKEEIIDLHSGKQYHVYMPGFLPGFVYMGETDEQISVPRKKEPVPVKAGAVGIAGRQTGIYPVDSPGGWNIAGYTPYKLFDPTSDKPCLLEPGDVVQFRSICIDDYYKMKTEHHS